MPVSLQRDLAVAGGVGIVGAGLLFAIWKRMDRKTAREKLAEQLRHTAAGAGFTKEGRRLLFEPKALEEYREYVRELSIPQLEGLLDGLQTELAVSEDDRDQDRARYLLDMVTDKLASKKDEKAVDEQAFREKIWKQMDEASDKERERLVGPNFGRLISTMSENELQKLYRAYATQFVKQTGNPEYLQLRMWKIQQVADKKKFTLPDYDDIRKEVQSG